MLMRNRVNQELPFAGTDQQPSTCKAHTVGRKKVKEKNIFGGLQSAEIKVFYPCLNSTKSA